MVSATNPVSQPSAFSQHQYGTRIRNNSFIRPSARLRQSPDFPTAPRKIKPVPTPKAKSAAIASEPILSEMPVFPPAHVVLHSDDATSKVFVAIGRALMSVDNRAMTIKDLAEMTMTYGLSCQNASAAGQAITTYIRNHLQRCEVQQDHPLLLRHVLSGTASDDELVPALHSRVGGAHCMLNSSENRVTNFRRGTMVWYLSKAAGAPCPFARAGIRLSDYGENGKVGSTQNSGRERKRERDRLRRAEQCGQKRKRLLRACADKESDSDSVGDEEKRPPKVKLTLKLKPCHASASSSSGSVGSTYDSRSQSREIIDLSRGSDSESDSDDISAEDSRSSSPAEDDDEEQLGQNAIVGSLPNRSTSVPSYGSSPEGLYTPSFQSTSAYLDFSRSFSIPYSADSASPPPDSEEEDEDFHNSMIGIRRSGSVRTRTPFDEEDDEDDMDWDDDFFGDNDADTETQWESPGPRSPSVQFEDEVIVKQEPNDVPGLLAQWDDLESMKVVHAVEKAVVKDNSEAMGLKQEEPEERLPSCDDVGSTSLDSCIFKPEEEDMSLHHESSIESLLQSRRSPAPEVESPLSPDSPFSPTGLAPEEYARSYADALRRSDFCWNSVELPGLDSLKPHELDDSVWTARRDRRRVFDISRDQIDASSSSRPSPGSTATGGLGHSRVLMPPRLDLAPRAELAQGTSSLPSVSSPSFLVSLTSLSLNTPTSPRAPDIPDISKARTSHSAESVPSTESGSTLGTGFDDVVHSCEPCHPDIYVSQVDGVYMYQIVVNSSTLLRRVDTDFVNITSLFNFLYGPDAPLPDEPDTVHVEATSASICGKWMPLEVAQEYAKDHPLLAIFVSDHLHERFPARVHDIRALTYDQSIGRFGPPFTSNSTVKRRTPLTRRLGLPLRDAGWDRGMISHWDVEERLLSAVLGSAVDNDLAMTETPLSPTEEEMFRVLCSNPDWETSRAPSPPLDVVCVREAVSELSTGAAKEPSSRDRPLRRSKRVANAIATTATRSRTRSSKRGSRSSLS